MEKPMKKLAVIFPGIGYHSERPLLYYAKKLAKESGFDIVEVSYDNLPKENKLLAFQMAMEMAEEILEPILFETYDSILFISKSIGTEVASTYEERIEKKVYNIYFTPIEESLPILHSEGIVFTGTSDTWVKTENVVATCEKKGLKLYTTEHANHSMEVGSVLEDLVIQAKIARECKKYLASYVFRDKGNNSGGVNQK